MVDIFYGYCGMGPRGRFFPYLYITAYIRLFGIGYAGIVFG